MVFLGTGSRAGETGRDIVHSNWDISMYYHMMSGNSIVLLLIFKTV